MSDPDIWPHVYERWAARSGAECVIWVGEPGAWAMVYAARVCATEAAHWFFKAHPGHKQIREETPCTTP